jgi:hypothetical protein
MKKKQSDVRAPKDRAGNAGELHQSSGGSHPAMTTQQGAVIGDDENSLRVSTNARPGPGLLEDFLLREKINHFDHERIPERIVHARGAGAHGFFELTDPLTDFTKARVLSLSLYGFRQLLGMLGLPIWRAMFADSPSSSTPRKEIGIWSAITFQSSSFRTQ